MEIVGKELKIENISIMPSPLIVEDTPQLC